MNIITLPGILHVMIEEHPVLAETGKRAPGSWNKNSLNKDALSDQVQIVI